MPASLVEAIQRRDEAALDRLLAADGVFHSPVQSYKDREIALSVLKAVAQVIESMEIVSEFERDGERVTFVSGTAGGQKLDGVIRELGDEQAVREVTLMVRPLGALQVAMERMRQLLA
jgi:hypothetical protein